jgi:Nif-specific regulatory protein
VSESKKEIAKFSSDRVILHKNNKGQEMSPAERKVEYIEAQTLHTLQEVAHALASSPRVKPALQRTLDVLSRYYEARRGAVFLRQHATSEIRIEASRGITPDEQKTLLRIEDGLTDRVFESGKPVVVPNANSFLLFTRSDSTQPINQAGGKTFICVPIIVNRETLGALLLEMDHQKYRDYSVTLGSLEVVASLIGQAVKIADLIDVEKHIGPGRQPGPVDPGQPAGRVEDRYDFSNLVGNSGPMQQIYDQIAKVAGSNATVMVRGESGTGKELIAHAIHYNSTRKTGPFIKVNCAALPDTLIESELFGYEKGAFTGAQAQKKGRFELAEGGTLFLDEIGELNASTSVKLLRVLQEREFERVGGTRTVKADVRLIVATNKDLEKAIIAGAFREDLFYRLNVFTIFLPPLRERKPDVLLLADHFLDVFNSAHGKSVKRISTQAIDMLMSYHWPGNVRELSNTIERAVLICDDHVIHGYHLPPTLQTADATGTLPNVSLKNSVDAYEKDLIQDTLKTTRGNRARAAKLLRTTERVINYKARKYGIDCARFK